MLIKLESEAWSKLKGLAHWPLVKKQMKLDFLWSKFNSKIPAFPNILQPQSVLVYLF